MNLLSNAKVFIFDLDGTVYCDGALIGDAKNTLNFLRERGCKIVFLTNNSSCTTSDYKGKLKSLDILEEDDVVYSSLDCAVEFIKTQRKDKLIYPLATKSIREYLLTQGLKISNGEDGLDDVDMLLLTFDKEIDYHKIVIANELLVMGKEYISTHPDVVCPAKGIAVPDAGAFIQMLKASSGRVPDIILGKPFPYMAEGIVDRLGVKKEQVFMVGDRLYTDIQFGINSKINTVTVLSGETTEKLYKESAIKSDFLIKDINEIPKLIREGK